MTERRLSDKRVLGFVCVSGRKNYAELSVGRDDPGGSCVWGF